MQMEPSNELFTFVDCSQKNSGGIVKDLEVQIGNALVPVDFHVLDIKLNWNSSLLLGRAFLSTIGAVCNLHTNRLCLTLIDPDTQYDPIPVKKSQTLSRRINDPGIIAACHCEVEYETDYSASKVTPQHRSTVAVRYRPTDDMENQSTVIQTIGRTTTAIPLLPLTPDKTCLQRSMRRSMRSNELLSTEQSLTRKINSYIIPPGKGMYHRSTKQAHHRSILNLIGETRNEHRPTLPTTNPSTLTSIVLEKETTQLAVGQTNTTMKSLQ